MTDSEMKKMQQEAMRRAQEMQRRAASYGQQGEAGREQGMNQRGKPTDNRRRQPDRAANTNTSQSEKQVSVPDIPPQSDAHKESRQEYNDSYDIPEKPDLPFSGTGGLFDTLFKDKEKTLILGLILLLMDESSDNSLIMALMYLLI